MSSLRDHSHIHHDTEKHVNNFSRASYRNYHTEKSNQRKALEEHRERKKEQARIFSETEERRRTAQILLQAEKRQKLLDSLYLLSAGIQALNLFFVLSGGLYSFFDHNINKRFFLLQFAIEAILLVLVAISITSTKYACRILLLIVYIITILYDIGNISIGDSKSSKKFSCDEGAGVRCLLPNISLDETTISTSMLVLIFHIVNFLVSAICCIFFDGSMDNLKSTESGRQLIRTYLEKINHNPEQRKYTQNPKSANIAFSPIEHKPRIPMQTSPVSSEPEKQVISSQTASESIEDTHIKGSQLCSYNKIVKMPYLDDSWSKILKRENNGKTYL